MLRPLVPTSSNYWNSEVFMVLELCLGRLYDSLAIKDRSNDGQRVLSFGSMPEAIVMCFAIFVWKCKISRDRDVQGEERERERSKTEKQKHILQRELRQLRQLRKLEKDGAMLDLGETHFNWRCQMNVGPCRTSQNMDCRQEDGGYAVCRHEISWDCWW